MIKILALSTGLALSVAVAGCKKNGGSDSEGAMKMNGNSGAATAPMATTYTCTMHPEVKSDKPGKCPKCGMALVPKQ
jgi:hypothetical protein